jgi:hypothetical protein
MGIKYKPDISLQSVVDFVMSDRDIDLSKPSTDNDIPVAVAMVVSDPIRATHPVSFSFSASGTMTPQQIGYLQEQGFPNGLARELGNTRATYPLRFWVVDNSGSMRTNDGHQLRGAPNKIRVVPCNRWTELQGAVEYHAELAGILEATTTFRMLNDPGPKVGPQEFTVASDAAHIPVQSEVNQAVKIIRKSEPSGVTPLSEHLQEIRLRIEAVAPSLKAGGQQAVIVLATDGLPSDKKGESKEAVKNEFLASLRSLQNLPVWVVIRLCTDDEEIVTFYNDLDAVLELPFEVIDDFFGEGKEIYSANKWLNYGLPLHRCREMGYHHRIFDLLDERLLNKDELREFLELLFGADTLRNAPDIHLDWKGFASIVKQVVYANGTIFNPYTKRLDYWVDMKQLEKCYDNTRGFRLFGRRK